MRVSKLSRLLTLCGALLLSAPVLTAEPDVYESLDDVDIGRVFLTPEQRARLDQRRGKPTVVVAGSGGSGKASKTSPDAAGYIVTSTGHSRVWSNGDFVAADEVSNVRFPGDVRVTRSAAKPDADSQVAEDVD